jgi:lipopolysaccharide heptosyltransferase I
MPGAAQPGEKFLIVRMGSMGDVVHTLPAAAALRESFPQARIDWLIERRWRELVERNPGINEIVALDRRVLRDLPASIGRLRSEHYTCTLDFQSLYKSSLLAYCSGAPRRVGFDKRYAREPGAAFFYTQRIVPSGTHVVEQNLSLVESVGARKSAVRFPLAIPAGAEAQLERELKTRRLREFFVLVPAGGWRSKCWPAERFGELHAELSRRHGWRGVVSFGPGEEALAEEVRRAAGSPEPAVFTTGVPQLMALLRRAKFVVAGDTGPLHLAVALGTPVIGLYGPTDPARNGPYCRDDIVVRNAGLDETTYQRGAEYSAAMLSIQVEQVLDAVQRRLGMR